jgi:hypothetical protein
MGGSTKNTAITSSEHRDRWRSRFVSALRRLERTSNTNKTQESDLPAATPVAGSINIIGRFFKRKRSPGFSTHAKDTGLEKTQGFLILVGQSTTSVFSASVNYFIISNYWPTLSH